MIIIIHRINTINELAEVPEKYGVEVDVRGYGKQMLLNHDPIVNPQKHDNLADYLKEFRHRFIIFNVKEAGYEQRVIEIARQHGIEDYFLLDVEFPFIYQATRQEGFRKIAVRYSEAEPIENVLAQTKDGRSLLDWVWIDTNTRLPLDMQVIGKLRPFKTCLVCPSRWGRPEDIRPYRKKMESIGFRPDAVMTSLELAGLWEK